jgi:ribose 5-phosphate isomerase A
MWMWFDAQRGKKQPGIITCSALKRSYRQIVIGGRPEVRLVYLRGSRDLLAEHLAGRRGHFMPASLLSSQFDALGEPDQSEDPLIIEEATLPARTPEQIADEIIRPLGTWAIVTSSLGDRAHRKSAAKQRSPMRNPH